MNENKSCYMELQLSNLTFLKALHSSILDNEWNMDPKYQNTKKISDILVFIAVAFRPQGKRLNSRITSISLCSSSKYMLKQKKSLYFTTSVGFERLILLTHPPAVTMP
ncbi:hypothetical protein NPIL_193071 [Nephila pilipes]|uniref:Uncharacterized protein n=1 Tax=Nephila pilipes TaxID=299642 RepID=A0A8X6R510_NEPPI|nr:hypothetical protein NPIL_193071 [Nephila pilipes]